MLMSSVILQGGVAAGVLVKAVIDSGATTSVVVGDGTGGILLK